MENYLIMTLFLCCADLTTTVAAPPAIKSSRVATIRELDSALLQHSGFMAPAVDGNADLSILLKSLVPRVRFFFVNYYQC